MSCHVDETYEYSPAAALSRTRVTGTALFTAEPPLREYLHCFALVKHTVPIRTGMSNSTIMSETIYLIELSFSYTY